MINSLRFFLACLVALALTCIAAYGTDSYAATTGTGLPVADHLLSRLQALEEELDLDATQKLAWEWAQQATRAAVMGQQPTALSLKEQAKQLLTAKQATGNELRLFFERVDAERDATLPNRKALREQWIEVYEQLTPAQQAKVRGSINQELTRLENLRGRLEFFRWS